VGGGESKLWSRLGLKGSSTRNAYQQLGWVVNARRHPRLGRSRRFEPLNAFDQRTKHRIGFGLASERPAQV